MEAMIQISGNADTASGVKTFQSTVNLLAPELFFLILAHFVYKM
jgi:hypothetical protein